MLRTVTAKLANMRKPQRFVVQRDQTGTYLVQSNKSIGKFDGKGRGILNTKGCYFHHLTPYGGALSYLYPAEFVQECQELFVIPGEKIGEAGGSKVIYNGLTTVGATKFSLLEQYMAYENNFASHDKITVEVGTIMWNTTEKKLMPYEGGELTGHWRRYSSEQFDANLAEIIAAETVEEPADGTD